MVDDPYDFGQIAAANALSDIYAMGGEPLTALNLVCWPSGELDPSILGSILEGGAAKAHEAGCALVGGHSVQDEELKYGMAVTGIAHPDRIVTNAGACVGDELFLTKPLGTGALTTALKQRRLKAGDLEACVTAMKTLNAAAMRVALDLDVHAATDITGFGLAGHGSQLAEASGVTLEIDGSALPLFDAVAELLVEGFVPGGGLSNERFFAPFVNTADSIPEGIRKAIFDPQTSGGLLLALPASERTMEAFSEAGVFARRVGTVIESDAARIRLR